MRKILSALSLAAVICALGLQLAAPAAADYDPADNYRPLRYSGSEGSNGNKRFDVTWPFEAGTDLRVYVSTDAGATWTQKTYSTEWTTTGEGTDAGGKVNLETAIANGDKVVILRDDSLDRPEDFSTLTPLAVNAHMDRQTIQFQQTEDIVEQRCVQAPYSNDYSGSGFSPVLPQVDAADSRHAITVKRDALGFDFSAKSTDDWACLTCPPATCTGGANDGDACGGDADCPDGVCTDGFVNCDYVSVIDGTLTCANGTCPDSCGGGGGGECSTCGGDGQCLGGDNDGDPCSDDADCPGGGTCGFGTCAGGSGDGDACTDDADCAGGGTCEYEGCLNCDEFSAVCSDGESLAWDAATERFTCRAQGVCDGGTNDGSRCTIDTDCPTGECVFTPPGICFGGSGDGDACTDDADCAGGGTCRPDNDVCLGGDADGDACTTDADCIGTCTALACADLTVCADNADCAGTCVDDRDTCTGGANDGDICQWDSDCPDGFCAACRTCFGGGSADQVCDNDIDCPSGICMACEEGEACVGGTGDGDACTDDADCAGGGTCELEGDGVGVLGPAAATPGAFARWDGDTGKYLMDSIVNLQSGIMTGPRGYVFRGRGQTSDSYPLVFTSPMVATNTDGYANYSAWYSWPAKSPKTLFDDAVLIGGSIQLDWVTTSPATGDGNFATTPTYWSPAPYPITVFQPGLSTNAQLVARIYFTEPVICPDNWAGSEGWNASTMTGSATYNFQKNGSTVGTAVFDTDAGPNEAVLATSGAETSFAAGDFLDIDAPATADATGGNLSFSLKCYRSIADEEAQ